MAKRTKQRRDPQSDERRRVLKGGLKRRDKIFLATKLYTNTRAEAQMLFERSLTRLKTDHVDLLHLHSVGERNLDTALSPDGAWSYILEQKAKGLTRFVGITGHNNPPNFMRMLATNQVDVLMTIMNCKRSRAGQDLSKKRGGAKRPRGWVGPGGLCPTGGRVA